MKSILVVDDSVMLAEMFRDFLINRFECKVDICVQSEYLAKILAKPSRFGFDYDVVLTDLNMPPGPNGVEIARLVKANTPAKVILMSADPDTSILAQRENLPFLPKLSTSGLGALEETLSRLFQEVGVKIEKRGAGVGIS